MAPRRCTGLSYGTVVTIRVVSKASRVALARAVLRNAGFLAAYFVDQGMDVAQPRMDAGMSGPRRGGGVVFWVLVLLALSALAPCVILPEWRQYELLSLAEQAQQHRADQLKSLVDREQRLLDAMRSDPAVISRLAQRDLSFRRPHDRAFSVSVTSTTDEVPPAFVPRPPPPTHLSRLASGLASRGYDRVFCEAPTRPIILAMSTGLIAVAFGLFCLQPKVPTAASAR